jgi:hypothetical protein
MAIGCRRADVVASENVRSYADARTSLIHLLDGYRIRTDESRRTD